MVARLFWYVNIEGFFPSPATIMKWYEMHHTELHQRGFNLAWWNSTENGSLDALLCITVARCDLKIPFSDVGNARAITHYPGKLNGWIEVASSEQATRHFAVLQFASSRISWVNWNETQKLCSTWLKFDIQTLEKLLNPGARKKLTKLISLLHIQNNIGLKQDEMRFGPPATLAFVSQ